MRFRQIFSVGSLPFKKVRHGVEPEPINTHAAPIVQNLEYFFLNYWIVIVQVRLMVKESMPIILLRYRVPHPIGGFKILKNNPDVFILSRVVRPYVKITVRRTFWRLPGTLKPGMLVRSMVDDELCYYFQITLVGFF